MATLIPPHRQSARRASASPRRLNADRPTTTAATSTSPPTNPRYEMCVCMQNDPANTAIGSIARSSASTDHTASTNTNHHRTGRYGFHGSVRRNAPYARQHREHRGDREQERATTAPQGHPQREPHRHDVERDVGGEQPVRGAAEQLPHRPQRVEAQRSGVAPAVRPERSDATGQPDQRRVAGCHVAHADLGLRHVEQRVPVRTAQLDERDDEREREDDEQRGEEQSRGTPEAVFGRQLARVDRRIECYVIDWLDRIYGLDRIGTIDRLVDHRVDFECGIHGPGSIRPPLHAPLHVGGHGSAFNARSKPGRTGD